MPPEPDKSLDRIAKALEDIATALEKIERTLQRNSDRGAFLVQQRRSG
jgi:hypothetical protein